MGQCISSRVPRLLHFLSRELSAQYSMLAATAATICHSFVERKRNIERHASVLLDLRRDIEGPSATMFIQVLPASH